MEPYSQGRHALTLEEFASKFKALLRRANKDGLNRDDFCAIAKAILENGWQLEEKKG